MCFSAEVSFISSALLTASGVIAHGLVRNNQYRLLASMPLLFAMHQAIEGGIWLSFFDADIAVLKPYLIHAYFLFAYVLLPTIWPLVFYHLESDPSVKHRLRLLSVAGFLLAAYLLIFLITEPVSAHPLSLGIRYTLDFPFKNPIRVMYLLVAAAPCLCHSLYLKILGYATLLACVVTFVAFWGSFISTWCFFTAILSMLILLKLRTQYISPSYARGKF